MGGMAQAAPTLSSNLEIRAQSYLRFAIALCTLTLPLTVVMDTMAVGVDWGLITLRILECLLPLALFYYGYRNPKWHRPVVYVALGWWGFFDALGNLRTNEVEITLMMGSLLLAAEGVFVERTANAAVRQLLHSGAICLGLYLGGFIPDERALLILSVGNLAGVLLSGGGYLAEKRSFETQLQAWKAQIAAEEAAASRVNFLGRMSHELRTPLNGMLGMLQLLQDDGPLNPDQREDLRIARQSSTQLLTLVTDILDFSAMTTGKTQASAAPTRLHPLLADRVSQLRVLAPQLRVDLTASSVPPGLMLDGPRVMRVVDVLLDNAAKFTHRGSICIDVQHLNDVLTIEVTDSGVGLPEDTSRLFDAFEQGDGTRTRRYGGAGLGLAISKHLADTMGGSLSARSRIGHGSIFSLSVPASACTPPSVTHGTARRLSGHLLIVEDNPINQMVLKGLLHNLGLSSATCMNGKEALLKIESEHFDGVLMDFHMPVMDGMEATRRMRAQGLALPIIGVSASVMPQDKRAALASGMDHTLAKPVDRSLLELTLADYLPAACISRHTSVA